MITSYRYWLLMKNKPGELEKDAQQVYSDKFTEYDKVWHLANWLNRHNSSWSYWLKEM